MENLYSEPILELSFHKHSEARPCNGIGSFKKAAYAKKFFRLWLWWCNPTDNYGNNWTRKLQKINEYKFERSRHIKKIGFRSHRNYFRFCFYTSQTVDWRIERESDQKFSGIEIAKYFRTQYWVNSLLFSVYHDFPNWFRSQGFLVVSLLQLKNTPLRSCWI